MNRKERSFGFTVGGLFLLLGAYLHWRGKGTSHLFLPLGILLVLSAWWRPSSLRIPNLLWGRLGQLLGRINSSVILTAIYFCVMTLLGILFRLCGRDALRLKRNPETSGWSDSPSRLRDAAHYERMY